MKLKDLNTMYVWTIILLTLLAFIGSLYKNMIPAGLITAVASSSIFDLLAKIILKKRIRVPYSALITGLIIGSVAQFNSQLYVIVLASALAIGSKYAMRLKKSHIFNPAAFGLFISLFLFSYGDEWWITESLNVYGLSIILTPILIIASYKALKLPTSLSFLFTVSILFTLVGLYPLSFSGAFFIGLFYSLPYYLAFIMVSEPKTSPYPIRQQICFGFLTGFLFIIFIAYSIPYPLLTPLLISNAIFSIYKIYSTRK